MNKYQHLNLPSPSKKQHLNMRLNFPYDFKYTRLASLTRFFWSSNLVVKIANYIVNFNNMLNSGVKTSKSIKLLESPIESAGNFDSPYGYEDDFRELKVALHYQKQSKDLDIDSESKILYQHINSVCSVLIEKTNAKDFFNFGISYAYIDSVLAKQFPSVSFSGIDRSNFTKLLNELNFSNIDNLTFHSGDVFDYLQNNQSQNGIFFHTRTLTLLPKEFIEKLYKSVTQAGFKYIVCMEQVGISRQTMKPYEFSEENQPSIAYREGMYIHNYPYLLEKVGFSVERSELLKTDQPHSDYRILSITAKKK